MLHALWKGKGAHSVLTNWRGVVIASGVAKSWHTWGANQVEKQTADYLLETQFGSRKRMGTDFASHAVRSLISHALENKLCTPCCSWTRWRHLTA